MPKCIGVVDVNAFLAAQDTPSRDTEQRYMWVHHQLPLPLCPSGASPFELRALSPDEESWLVFYIAV